ncbi:hypothetical protein BCY84_12059 [Trypanosoma cruzi cruzi]|nr:hypothetical protein BCY84_12058 [Trypanosoma cruzi cruzi]PBJ74732.1 hypothetical protein BCY84_12059 [Trypanosoma cruzi cruzi]
MGGRGVLCTVAPLMALVVLSRGLAPLLCAPAVADAGDEGRSAPFFCVCVCVSVLVLLFFSCFFSLPALPSDFWSVTPRRLAVDCGWHMRNETALRGPPLFPAAF